MKKKKIFIAGKVREFDPSNNTLGTEISRDLKAKTGLAIPVSVVADVNSLTFIYHCNFKQKIQSGSIPEVMTWLISGEADDFSPKYSLSYGIPHFPNYDYNFPIQDYIEVHKKNSRFYHASRIKNMEIDLANKMEIKFVF